MYARRQASYDTGWRRLHVAYTPDELAGEMYRRIASALAEGVRDEEHHDLGFAHKDYEPREENVFDQACAVPLSDGVLVTFDEHAGEYEV